MLVISKAPIVEEKSNLTAEERKARRKRRSSKTGERAKSAYSRVKEAGALPVIENLLGLTPAPSGNLAAETPVSGQMPEPIIGDPNEQPKKGLSKGAKWAIGIGIVAIVGAVGYYYWKKGKGTTAAAVKG